VEKRIVAEPLLFYRRNALARDFAIGAFPRARLFTQCFSADLVPADFTDTAFQSRTGLGAYHAFFGYLSHVIYLPLV
jgi:hypothetical protein